MQKVPIEKPTSLMEAVAEHGVSRLLPKDIAAGIIIAMLSIPISMGYAEIIGLPPIYGLYASLLAPFLYALITSSRSMVFGMDSATAAVTAGAVASMGLSGQDLVSAMPWLTLSCAAFLVVFAILRAGKLLSFVPSPVMHGFIAGVSLSVIVSQIPGLIGTSPEIPRDFIGKVSAIFASVPDANAASVVLSLLTIAFIVSFRRAYPKVPVSMLAVAAGIALCWAANLENAGVAILGEVASGLPLPMIPAPSGEIFPEVVAEGFTVAIVVAIESLLCLETFSMSDNSAPKPNRELFAFGAVNAVLSVFACPPCSGSVSRTAAGKSAGGLSQLASIIAAAVVAAALLFLAPLLYYMPKPVLCSIVVIALVDVVDFSKIRRYGEHMRVELAVFVVSTLITFAGGAMVGVVCGIIMSFVIAAIRARSRKNAELLGIVADDEMRELAVEGASIDASSEIVAIYHFHGRLTFANVNSKMSAMSRRISDETQAVVLDFSDVPGLDATATDKLIQSIQMMINKGKHVRLVRSIAVADDSYTRYEMRRLLSQVRSFDTVAAALGDIERRNKILKRKRQYHSQHASQREEDEDGSFD